MEVPTDIVFQVLYCRLRFRLSYPDMAELFWLRGFDFSHETVREWSERFAPEFAEHIRNQRQQTFSRIWYVDESYVRIHKAGGATSIEAWMSTAICSMSGSVNIAT